MTKEGTYNVNLEKGEGVLMPKEEDGWCSNRVLLWTSVVTSTILYFIGAIISGVTFRQYGMGGPENCTFSKGTFMSTKTTVYLTPFTVVGPCFMSAGGAILLFLLFQWCLCRPIFKS